MSKVLCVGLLGCHWTSSESAQVANYLFSGAFTNDNEFAVYTLNGKWSDEHHEIMQQFLIGSNPELVSPTIIDKPKFDVTWESDTPLKKWGICLCMVNCCLQYNGYVFPIDSVKAPDEIHIDNDKYILPKLRETDKFVVYVDIVSNFSDMSADDMANHVFEIIAKQQGM